MFTQRIPLPIAVIDTETTGLHWTGHDRICEISIVVMAPDGEILSTYETLVNPERDLGPTHIHGIDAQECACAPTFADIAGDISTLLAGTGALAGHNIIFDQNFLAAEYQRINAPLDPQLQTICTYRLLHTSLTEACAQWDIKMDGKAHSALVDALATAQILQCLAKESLVDLGLFTSPLALPVVEARRCAPVPRSVAHKRVAQRSGFLDELTDRVAYSMDRSDTVALDYLSLLRRILEDRVLDEGERDLLHAFVADRQLGAAQVATLHHRYLDAMAVEAWSDEVVTEHELNDLKRLARLLDLDVSAVDSALEAAEQSPPDRAPTFETATSELAGASVCFTGTIVSNIDGQVITKALASQMAEAAGLQVKGTVSKKLNLLVVADPNTQSGKAKKAREYGTRIVAERDFWPMIGVTVS